MTKPTKQQEKAGDKLAEALLLATEAARLDGRATFGKPEIRDLAAKLLAASSVFGLDVIVPRALDRRALGLGLPPGTAELLTLLEGPILPLDMLLLDDDAFRAHVAAMEQELG